LAARIQLLLAHEPRLNDHYKQIFCI